MIDDSPDIGISELSLSPCGRILILLGSRSKKVSIYDAATGYKAHSEKGKKIRVLALSSDLMIYRTDSQKKGASLIRFTNNRQTLV